MTCEGEIIVPPFADALLSLADCLCERLAETPGGPPCWCGPLPGQEAPWDYCGGECGGGACGIGYVRLDISNPSDTFPIPTLDLTCAKPMAYRVELGVLRCVPQPADGELLDPALMFDVVMGQWHDMYAMQRAIMCCDGYTDRALEAYTPLGPQGACVGGAWTFWMGLD